MVGDIVWYGKRRYATRLVNVDGLIMPFYDLDDTKVCYGSVKDIEPICLTADILLRNGFREEGGGYVRFFPDKGLFTTFTSRVDGRQCLLVGSLEVAISHVHEFQHILRICGLGDIADAFKV